MPKASEKDALLDLFIIGGGVNGCGIARDAAGRGLKVALAEMGDLAQATSLILQFPFLSPEAAEGLVHLYGRNAAGIFEDVVDASDMGRDFGHGLTEAELRYLVREEFAREVEDVIWRRTKLGLRLTAAEIAAIDDGMRQHVPLLVEG